MASSHYDNCAFFLSGVQKDCTCKGRMYRDILVVTLVIFLGEFMGGIFTGSLALLGDSFHVLADSVTIVVAATVSWVITISPVQHKKRLLRLGTLVMASILFFTAWEIFSTALERMATPQSVSPWMIPIAIAGAGGNILQHRMIQRHGHERHHHDHMAAWHIMTDFGQSIAVIIGGSIMVTTGIYAIDAWLSVGIAVVLAVATTIVVFNAIREKSGHHHH